MDAGDQVPKLPVFHDLTLIRVVRPFYPVKGGSITHTSELIRKMTAHIGRQTVICPRYDADTEAFDRDFEVPVIRIRDGVILNPDLLSVPVVTTVNMVYFAFNTAMTVRRANLSGGRCILQVHSFDIGIFTALFCRLLGLSCPVVVMTHGHPDMDTVGHTGRVASVYLVLRKFSIRVGRPGYFFLLDDGTLYDPFVDLIRRSGIPWKVLYHAIDTDFYSPPEKPPKKDLFVVLSNNRIAPRKNIDLAVLAFGHFLNRAGRPEDVRLRLLGGSPDDQNIRRLVEERGLGPWVEFGGEKTIIQTRDEIQQADVVIGPALDTNTNRAMHEAMACGKALVVFKTEQMGVIFRNEENCLVAGNGDTAAFGEQLLRLYRDPSLAGRIGRAACESILRTRNWPLRLDAELQAYNGLPGGR